MNSPRAAAELHQPVQLRNGLSVLIRPVRADDRQRIVDAFHKLDKSTVYTRFFSAKRELSEADLGRLESSDFVRAVALVATLGEGADEIIIGGGAYTVLPRPDEPHMPHEPQMPHMPHEPHEPHMPITAELSFTIEEDYQGQGLSTMFMDLLTRIARERGVRRFEADVLAGNQPMLKVFERSGLPMHSRVDDGVVHVTLELDAAAPTPPG